MNAITDQGVSSLRDANWRPRRLYGAADVSSGSARDITYRFLGQKPADATEQANRENWALHEFYEELFAKRPDAQLGADAIKAAVLQHPRIKDGGVTLYVLKINPEDRTGSFTDSMPNLKNFLKTSRSNFLTDAIDHLGTLTGSESEDRSKRFKLCNALIKAENDGHLEPSHKAAIEALKAQSPVLRNSFNYAESRAISGQSGITAPIAYDERPRDDGRAA